MRIVECPNDVGKLAGLVANGISSSSWSEWGNIAVSAEKRLNIIDASDEY